MRTIDHALRARSHTFLCLLLFLAAGAVGCGGHRDEKPGDAATKIVGDTGGHTAIAVEAGVVPDSARDADHGDGSITLLPFPRVTVLGPTRATDEEAKEIRKLINDLVDLDTPDYGLSATLSGGAFAPIPSSGAFGSGILTDHGLKTNHAFKRLVEFGPKALPFLLESLDDPMATKLEVDRATLMGAAWLGHEIRGNPVNRAEAVALKEANTKQEDEIDDEYTVRVGDVCFVAIGQITNRSYSAVRYQPTGCLVINSPVKDKKLASEVRKIWGRTPDSQKFLDSLLIDFYSRGERSTGFQAGAAMRLAYYFPKESMALIVERLNGLDVTATDSSQMKNGNGVWSSFLIKSMLWSSDPRISAAILDIFKRTTSESTVMTCLPAIGNEHDELVFGKLTKLLDERVGIDGKEKDHTGLLSTIGRRFPERANKVFRLYLEDDSLVRRQTVCRTLMGTCGQLSIELLHPFLADKRDAPGSIILSPVKQQLRVCDLAADAIAQNFPDLKFGLYGTHEDLDRQIEEMTQTIASIKKDD
jgi:hypothetical protein